MVRMNLPKQNTIVLEIGAGTAGLSAAAEL
jgi:monoamine oxidase